MITLCTDWTFFLAVTTDKKCEKLVEKIHQSLDCLSSKLRQSVTGKMSISTEFLPDRALKSQPLLMRST